MRIAITSGLAALALATCLPLQAASEDIARTELGKLQLHVRGLLTQGGHYAVDCEKARGQRQVADDQLLAADIAQDDGFAALTRAALQAQQREGADCTLKTMHEDRVNVARGLLRQAATAFEHCRLDKEAKDREAACERTTTLAADVARAGAAVDTVKAVIAAAKDAQGNAAKLKEAADNASKMDGKAVSGVLAEHGRNPTEETANAVLAVQSAQARAADVFEAASHAQAISKQLETEGLALAKCKSRPEPCKDDDPEVKAHMARGKLLADDMVLRGADWERVVRETKLAAFNVDPAVLRAPANQRADAVAFLKLIDSNPDVGSLFGGEAIRLSAGKKGGEASIRVDLDRFVNTPTKDFALILTAPVGDGSSTALYDSSDGVTSGASATLAYRFTPRLLKGDSLLPYLYQLGVQASLGYATHSYRSLDDIAKAVKDRSTPWSLGGQVIYAKINGTLLHQLGINYKVETGYADGVTKLTRCPSGLAGQTSVACVNAYFQAPEQRAGWEFSYNVRFKAKGMALSPVVSYDRRTRVTSYELPIYLIGDVEKKSLTAGVALMHSSSGKGEIAGKSTIRLFVSSPFSLFGE